MQTRVNHGISLTFFNSYPVHEGRRQGAGGSPDEKCFHHQVMKVGALLFPIPYFQIRKKEE
ncbi:MAG: hypothetical protein F6J86_04075 [Symploca sp. SIO1B1]|nr:hypothetical protein [Symploca sp. SIO1C2]NER93015.1 hypothetical protein [Symploca sp. SIO1B1]